MPETIVTCSQPGCQKPANQKFAASWQDGRFSELKTYGYACAAHTDALLAAARKRRGAQGVSPGEAVGPVEAYPYPPL